MKQLIIGFVFVTMCAGCASGPSAEYVEYLAAYKAIETKYTTLSIENKMSVDEARARITQEQTALNVRELERQKQATEEKANRDAVLMGIASGMQSFGNSMQQQGYQQQQYQYQAPSAPSGPSAYDTFQKWNPPSTRQNCATTYHPIGKTWSTVCQ